MNGNYDQIPNKKLLTKLIIILLSLAILYLVIKLGPLLSYIGVFVKTIFLPFFIALIVAYLLHPIVTILHDKGVPRGIAIAIIYIIFFGSFTIILINAFPVLVKQIKDFVDYLPSLMDKVQGWLDNIRHDHSHPLPDSFQDGIDASIEDIEKKISDGFVNIIAWANNIFNMIFVVSLIPFVTFYMLKDYKLLEKTIMTFVPRKNRKEVIRLARDIDEALGNYIRGQLIVCTIIGVLAYIGYLIIGLPYSLLLASIVAITNIIPYLGPFIGAAPALIVGISISWKMALFVLLVNMTIQNLEGNIISPQIVGRKLNIHPLFIILSLMIGGEIAGLLGLILAVPVFAIIKVFIQHLSQYYLNR